MPEITEYHRPHTLEEALALLARGHVISAPIGGGSQLIAADRRDITAVVDLSELGLSYVRREADQLRVGATTTLQMLIDLPDARAAWQGELARVAEQTAARNLREQGTLAGTLVSAESNNPLAVALLAVEASLTLMPGPRSVALDEFLSKRAALLVGSLITEVTIPLNGSHERLAFEKVSRTPADLPIVCAAVRARVENRAAHDARIVLGGVADTPIVMHDPEREIPGLQPPSDFWGTAEYRRAMAGVLSRRAVQRLVSGP